MIFLCIRVPLGPERKEETIFLTRQKQYRKLKIYTNTIWVYDLIYTVLKHNWMFQLHILTKVAGLIPLCVSEPVNGVRSSVKVIKKKILLWKRGQVTRYIFFKDESPTKKYVILIKVKQFCWMTAGLKLIWLQSLYQFKNQLSILSIMLMKETACMCR